MNHVVSPVDRGRVAMVLAGIAALLVSIASFVFVSGALARDHISVTLLVAYTGGTAMLLTP